MLYAVPAVLLYQLFNRHSTFNALFLPHVTGSFMIGSYIFYTYAAIHPSSPDATPRVLDLHSFASTDEYWWDLAFCVWTIRRYMTPTEILEHRVRMRAKKPSKVSSLRLSSIPEEERLAVERAAIEEVFCMCRRADGSEMREAMAIMHPSEDSEPRTRTPRVGAWTMLNIWWLGVRVSRAVVVGCLELDNRAAGVREPMESAMAM